MTTWTELKRLAEEATGGDWEFRLGLIRTKHDSDGYVPVAVAPNSPKSWLNQRDLNMQFIAAANPKNILALIAENERLRDIANEQRHRLECLCEGTDGSTPALTRIGRLEYDRDQLRAEVEALRKDAERFNWLLSKFGSSLADLVTGDTLASDEDVIAVIDESIDCD